MKKFVNFYIVLLVLFIVLGLFGISITNDKETEDVIEKNVLENTPGYETMLAISEMTKEQQLQDAVLDIQVTPEKNNEIVLVKMQSSEFMTADILLKDSYNMLVKIANSPQIAEFTFVWYQVINSENTEVLTMTFDRAALDQLQAVSYKDLATIATVFEQHSELK
ncbi:hypothetical protein [Solibacillus sp. CAU 1738]|uniref:hypothetical protein n=1 Tax=Solibacillus sp. CAU 1738 TaxID=3140363 RepID=UPI00326164F1